MTFQGTAAALSNWSALAAGREDRGGWVRPQLAPKLTRNWRDYLVRSEGEVTFRDCCAGPSKARFRTESAASPTETARAG